LAAAVRLNDIGLRWRVAGWAVLVILLCLGIAFAAVYKGTGSQVRSQIDREMAGDGRDLARGLTAARAPTPAALAAAATRYVRGRPFSPSSTLLFATVPGRATSTNRPELFRAERPDNGESSSQQARENRLSRSLLTAPLGYSTVSLPDVGDLRLLKAIVHQRLGGRTVSVTTGVGEPLATVANAQEGVARAFVLAAVLAVLGAALGGYLIGSRTSQPLRRMAAVAARVDAGDLNPRIHPSAGTAGEVAVLAHAFNHMLDRLTAAFASQRAFVADASHELRTPLTIIRGQLEVLLEEEHPSPEEVRRVEHRLHAEIVRIGRLIDDLLLLTELEQAESLRPERIELVPFVEDLLQSTATLGARRFQLAEACPGTLLADPDRLAQALRNLITNAIKHTSEPEGEVVVGVQPAGEGHVRFVVEDDGPGIPAGERELVFERFHRTDPARDRASGGAGLGLAIVRGIALAHGGRATAGESERLGGARMELELPRFEPATPRAAPVPSELRS
jgi:two-component system, OmpR family, sensor kinase